MVGQWTTLTELWGIDAVAFDAWGKGERIGYEVKVSRSDLRRELLCPEKREPYKAHVHRLFLATPAGLLTDDEKAYKQPDDWTADDYLRPACTNEACWFNNARWASNRRARRFVPKPFSRRVKGTEHEGVTVHLGSVYDRGERYAHYYEVTACCVVCRGTGSTGPSRVEREAPTLWIPPDVGLLEVHGSGYGRVVRAAPRLEPTVNLTDKLLAQAVRWASNRPDPKSGWKDAA